MQGGVKITPPLGFFKKPRKRRKIWTQKKISVYQIHFPRFLKKSHVNCFSCFATVITFSTWVGGGENHPPPALIPLAKQPARRRVNAFGLPGDAAVCIVFTKILLVDCVTKWPVRNRWSNTGSDWSVH